MAVTVRPLIQPLLIAAGTTTQYTSPASGRGTIIDKFTVTNTTASPETITVYLVEDGGAAGAANTILPAASVAAGAAYTCPEVIGHVLAPGDFIATAASTGAALTVRSSGREVT